MGEEDGGTRGCKGLWQEVEVYGSLGNVEVWEDYVDGAVRIETPWEENVTVLMIVERP